MRRNLVIVRAGDTSLHPTWLPLSGVRSWDLVVSYFGDDPDRYRVPDVKRIDGKGPKWQGLHRLLERNLDLLDRYEYVWLPDDDIAVRPADVESLFTAMRQYDLLLAQPALTIRSYSNWTITMRNPATKLRWTNFVETMVPCFRADFLRTVMPTFAPYIIGSGLDWVWPLLAGPEPLRVAILDQVPVTHTRPFGGPNYRFFDGTGYTSEDETAHVLRTHGIGSLITRNLGLKALLGPRLKGDSVLGLLVLRAGYTWIICTAYLRRDPARWEIDKKLRRHLADPSKLVDKDMAELPDGSRYQLAQADVP
jgi:hypothetical protein